MSRSLRYSLLLAATYCTVAATYIVFSGKIAAQFATSVEDLEHIEMVKGIVYVAVTTLAVFFGGLVAMRRIDRDNEELLRRERALVQSEGRMMAGLMAATVAHDANNVLQSVIGNLSLLERRADTDVLEELDHGIARLVDLNRRLVGAARGAERAESRDVDVVRAVRDTIAGIRSHANVRSRRVNVRGDESMAVRTQPILLQQVVVNLVLNACEATKVGGRVDVAVLGEGDQAVLEVHDDGPGVPKERREHLFDALETTKASGSGLGLFSVRACVEAMGGAVEVEDSPLGGACFRVRVPRAVAAAAGALLTSRSV